MDSLKLKNKRYTKRRLRVKKKIHSNTSKPRVCISRSNKSLYAQIIDDSKGHTLVSASSLEKDFTDIKVKGNIAAAKKLGKILAERANGKGIKTVIFDRNGYLYHGKVKAFADSLRENGLEF